MVCMPFEFITFPAMRGAVLTALLILQSFNTFAQQNQVDSILAILDGQKPAEQLESQIELVKLYNAQRNIPEALLMGTKSLEKARELGNLHAEMRLNVHLADAYYRSGDYQNSILLYATALGEEFEPYITISGTVTCYNGLALSYRAIGDYESATKNIFTALELPELDREEYVSDRAILYMTLGGTYYYQDYNEKALEYFMMAMEMHMILQDSFNVAALQNNIGSVLLESGEYDKALPYFENAYAYFERSGPTSPLPRILNNMGRAISYQGNYSQAIPYFEKALILGDEISDRNSLANSYHVLGVAEHELGRYGDALSSLEESLRIAGEVGLKYVIKDNFERLSLVYEDLGNSGKALYYQRQFSALLDSIHIEEEKSELAFLESRYKFQEQLKEIDLLNADKELEAMKNQALEDEASKKDIQLYALLGGSGLLLVLAMVILGGYRNKKRANSVLQEQKQEIEHSRDELATKNLIIEEKNKDITDSIKYAQRIQEAILTTEDYLKKILPRHVVVYKPRDIVSGDFYWAFETDDRKVIIATVDCTGHGVPGAFMSMVGHSLLNEIVVEHKETDAGKILDKLKQGVIRSLKQTGEAFEARDGMDVAICVWDRNGKTLNFAGANNPLYYIRNKELHQVNADKQACGYELGENRPFTSHHIDVQPNDWFYIFSDGYADQFGGPKGKKFKSSLFQQLLVKIHEQEPQRQARLLDETIEAWRGSLEQIDDICVVGFQVS